MGGRNISRDPAVVAQFRDDPLVFHGRFPVRTGAEILRAGGLARAAFEQVRTPLLILHGTADRVAAVEASQELFAAGRGSATRRCAFIRDSITRCSTNRKKSKSWPI